MSVLLTKPAAPSHPAGCLPRARNLEGQDIVQIFQGVLLADIRRTGSFHSLF